MRTINVCVLLACGCPTAAPFFTPDTTHQLHQASQRRLHLLRSTGTRKYSPHLYSALRGGAPGSSSRASSSTTMSTPSYDVVVFGATSFVGQLICEYLLQNYGASPPTFKWAVAGR